MTPLSALQGKDFFALKKSHSYGERMQDELHYYKAIKWKLDNHKVRKAH